MKKNQKVICIDDSPGWIDGAIGLTKAEIYCIVDIIYNGDIIVSGLDGAWSTKRFKLFNDGWAEEILNKINEELLTPISR